MKKNIHYITIAAACMAVAAMIIGCNPNVSAAQDTTPPAEVTKLETKAGDGKVSLSWTNPTDADLHQVEITASPAAGSLAHPVYLSAGKGKAMSFTAEGLSNGTAYTFTVKTIDKSLNKSAGISTAEAVKPIDTSDKTPPAEVTELTAAAGNGKVSLSWTNPADADLYQVEITASPAAGTLAQPVYLSAEKGKAMSFTAEGLSNGTAYTFTVKTIDKSLNKSAGISTAEAVKPIDTSDKTPPAEVTELKATAGTGKITLSWTNPADADLHQVEIIVQKEGETAVSTVYISAEKGKDGGYIIEGLAANTTYTVTVKTIDKALNKSRDGVTKTVTTQPVSAVMTLTLTQNPTALTNENVTISFTSSTSIKTAKWKKGVHSAKDVLASGTAITDNSFTISENGKYSVGVQDNDGRREVETITIANIDKIPPAKVIGLAASYSSTTQKITVNWQNPPDSDFAGVTLSWKKGTGSETPVELTKDNTSYEIPNITADGSTYTIAVTAKDDVGNTGTPEETTVQATATTEITKVELNGRTHFDTVQTDRNITVTVSGSNFDKLTSLFVKVMDGSSSPVEATLDKPNNKATATVQAPKPTSPTDAGTDYIVKVFIDGTTESDKTATFKVSKPAEVKAITLSKNSIEFGTETKVTVSVTGTNFDIRGVTKIKLLASNGAEVSGSTVTVDADKGTATELSAEIPLPTKSGVYTCAVYFGEVKESKTSTLQLYGAPEITSVSIPKAGKSYGGNELPVTITGKNFTAPNISKSSFSGSGASIKNFKIVSDTLATAEVTCPLHSGDTSITVNCKSASKTGTLSVKDYSTGYEVGKIVLANNTPVDKGSYTAVEENNPPVGIICGSNSYGVPRMIALHTSGSGLSWAKDDSTGYTTNFEGIICEPSTTGSGAQTATFTGDTDGSDNWEYIKSIDPAGAADAAENYPAFHWVNQYNTQYAAQLGGTNFAWYMPSLAELCEVYKNRAVINESLTKIRGLDSNYADESLGTSWYWSSSQVSYSNDNAWFVNFSVGNVDDVYKYYDFRVCCLSGF